MLLPFFFFFFVFHCVPVRWVQVSGENLRLKFIKPAHEDGGGSGDTGYKREIHGAAAKKSCGSESQPHLQPRVHLFCSRGNRK